MCRTHSGLTMRNAALDPSNAVLVEGAINSKGVEMGVGDRDPLNFQLLLKLHMGLRFCVVIASIWAMSRTRMGKIPNQPTPFETLSTPSQE